MSRLEKRLIRLEERIIRLEIVGEIYVPSINFYTYSVDGYYWSKFTGEEITDRIDGYIKINHVWYSLDEVVFYRDENRIQNLKKKIEKKKEEKK